MSNQKEGRFFVRMFVLFILIEVVLYSIIVYWDVFGIKTDYVNSRKIRKDPAFLLFYGISSIVFMVFISRLGRSNR